MRKWRRNYSGHPLVDGDKLFCVVGGEGSIAVAFDKHTGTVLWQALSAKVQGYCPPTMVEAGGRRQLIIWDADLATGEQRWTTYATTTGGTRGAHSACAFLVKNGDRFFLTSETGDLIIARLTPQQYTEISRAKIMEPTGVAFGRNVRWSHPAFANRCIFARNDQELVCLSLAAEPKK